MPIATETLKILKSARMADTSDSGGPMTGIAVVDNVSNDLFPDISSGDGAFGRVNIRSVFGVAQTTDTDTLLGAHLMVSDAPDNPLVHCTLMKSPRWGAQRDAFKKKIEEYLVKGPLANCYVYEDHYAGTRVVRLFSEAALELPQGGDAIVLRSQNGSNEQFVRVVKVTTTTTKAGKRTVFVAQVEMGQALAFDLDGDDPSAEELRRTSTVHTTSVSGGAEFYGIKPLGVAGAIGDLSVTTSGGIFSPLVPAATVESPLVDQYPLLLRRGLSRTGLRTLTLPAVGTLWSAGETLATPTAIEPGSLVMSHGGTLFNDDAAGNLKQGTTVVGAIDYKGRTVQLNAGAPNYNTASNTITYKPATLAGAGTHSAAQEVTIANQGLVYTFAFEPPPAPGTFTLSYMAQGRWYVLEDNGAGRLVGANSGYGVGTISYATGSIGVTLGAIPDIGSALIYQWGTADAAQPYTAALPTKLSAVFDLPYSVQPASLTLAWSRGSANYSASCNAQGVLAGDATGTARAVTKRVGSGLSNFGGGIFGAAAYTTVFEVDFAPNVFPSGAVVATWLERPPVFGDAVNNGNGSYTLGRPPAPGSVSLSLSTVPEGMFEIPNAISVYDNGAGALLSSSFGSVGAAVGSVNYTTGAVNIATNVTMGVYERVAIAGTVNGSPVTYESRVFRPAKNVTLHNAGLNGISHSAGAVGSTVNQTITPSNWTAKLLVSPGITVQESDLAFECGNTVYYGNASVVSKGWVSDTALPVVENCGNLSGAGVVTVTSLPNDGVNTLSFANLALNRAGDMRVSQGVFRVVSAPLKAGVFQLQAAAQVANGNSSGVIAGGGFAGQVDYQRGIVRWSRLDTTISGMVLADELSYNAVYLQFLPLDPVILGIDTARLPLDGKVPIYRAGSLLVIHNTLTEALPNPLTKGTTYNLSRGRVASVRARTPAGATVPSALYAVDYDLGTINVPVASNITTYPQPWTIEHRVEDLVLLVEADISGKLKFARPLTHNFPANTSFASSALYVGDVFARAYGVYDQQAWTGEWADERVGNDTLANFNTIDYPIATTNMGAVTERWALIFTSNTAFRVVGEAYGQIATGDVNTVCAPINTATAAPFFTIPVLGWGAGWAAGNVLRFNTGACGANFGVVRTVLQGPSSQSSDKFTLAWRGDVNA